MSLSGEVSCAPLPGSPRGGTLEDALAAARADAEVLTGSGADGLIVENFGDAPFAKERVPPVTVAAMTAIARELRRDHNVALAYEGLLPMFGFPTRVRTLYTEKPSFTVGEDDDQLERELSIAISEWAPGAEVVKDKRLHRVVGVAAFQPRGRTVASLADPLGASTVVGLCRTCQSITTRSPQLEVTCPICAAPLGDGFEVVTLHARKEAA